jgi:EAL domain-containing protein (putative c-di-GMP-specific phosphodiesterase class I)
VCPADSSDPVALLNNADIAMYRAKDQGRNNVKFFASSMHDEILTYHRLETDLKNAVAREQLALLYQPQFRLADHRVDAVEALLRWNHPERGVLSPDDFLSVAEQSGHIIPMGVWVIEETCRQLKRWEAAGVPLPRVTINVAGMQFRQPGFHETVRRLLEAHSIDPSLIELEITEHSLMADTVGTRDCLRSLKRLGLRLAIDDFGAGYSCLSFLRQFPLDVLKIDQSFVSDLEKNIDAQVICSAILSIAHALSLDVVAEGIESEQQLAFLTRNDCLYGQGFFLSPPIEADKIGAMMVQSGGQATRRRRVTTRNVAAKTG